VLLVFSGPKQLLYILYIEIRIWDRLEVQLDLDDIHGYLIVYMFYTTATNWLVLIMLHPQLHTT
jgi:hypothetical protein